MIHGRVGRRTLKMRVVLAIAKWVLPFLERRIVKCRQHIADDLEMIKQMEMVGAQWPVNYLSRDIEYNKKRLQNHVELLKHTRVFILREGLS